MINQTKTITGTQNLAEFDLLTLEDNSTYKWNCLAYDQVGNSDWGDNNFTLIINSSYNYPPQVILRYPPHNGQNIPINVALNVTVIDPEGSDMNVTYFGREKNDTNWTLVALPDTQHYSEKFPAMFDNQTLWINSSKTDLNIKFVVSLILIYRQVHVFFCIFLLEYMPQKSFFTSVSIMIPTRI